MGSTSNKSDISFTEFTIPVGNPGDWVHDFQFLAINIAKKYSNRGTPIEDLIQAGLMDLMWSQTSWDPSKGSKNKWAAYCLHFAMIDATYNLEHRKYRPLTVTTDEGHEEERLLPAKKSWFDDLVKEMNEEARFLVYAILNAPDEITKDFRSTSKKKLIKARENLRVYLIDVRDWNSEKFEQAWNEVDTVLSGKMSKEEDLADIVMDTAKEFAFA